MVGWAETQQERRDLADFLEGLAPVQWDSVLPDNDWRVREVAAHVIQGATESMTSALVGIARGGFKYDAYYDAKARELGSREPSELIARLRAAVNSENRLLGLPGPKPMAMLAETFVHHQDLRHHLNSPRQIPEDRLVMVLDVAKTAGFPLGIKKRIEGVRLHATDIHWDWGDGPEVCGPGEAVLYAMLKKRVLLDELHGEGVAILTAKF